MFDSSTWNKPATVAKVASAAARSRTYPSGDGVCCVSKFDKPTATDCASAVVAPNNTTTAQAVTGASIDLVLTCGSSLREETTTDGDAPSLT